VLLRRHRADDSVNRAIGRLIRADLIVTDDIGMLPGRAERRRSAVPTASRLRVDIATGEIRWPQREETWPPLARSDGRRRGETDNR
jgi:hypothetical protein